MGGLLGRAPEVNGVKVTGGPQMIQLSLDGKLLGVLGKAGKQPKQFGWIHGIACPSENVLFVAEIINWRVQKLTLHPAVAK